MTLVFHAIASVAIAAIAFGQRLPLNSAPLPSTQEKTAAKTYLNIARSIFKNSKKPVSTDAETLYQRGLVKAKQGDYEGAIADYTQAIKFGNETIFSAFNYYGRAEARFAVKDYRGAIADYTTAIQLDPKSAATTYSKRAVARDRIGDKKGADEDRKAAASLPPEPEQRVFQTIGFISRQCQDKKH
ncbi:tetratricopeptide repeat protein [Chroococcidiopsis sp.]|uniref:tetratricopeptide repeat protein n=1 Tax=Chroococcidiopsis sp. TaxID=3088168 RepID=UPI003F304B07